MKVSEQFKSTIKAYLDNMAAVDSLFAPVYQKPDVYKRQTMLPFVMRELVELVMKKKALPLGDALYYISVSYTHLSIKLEV